MTQVLDKIKKQVESGRTKNEARYRKLVAAVVEDRETPDAAEILRETGRSVEDLKAAVDEHRKREQLRRAIDAAAGVDAERAELTEQARLANEEHKRADEKHAAALAPIEGRIEELDRLSFAAQSARAELLKTCSDADLRRRLGEITTARRKIIAKQAELNAHLDRLREVYAVVCKNAEHFPKSVADRDRAEKEIEETKRTLSGLPAELRKLDAPEREVLDAMVRA